MLNSSGEYSGVKVYELIHKKIIEKLKENGTIEDFDKLTQEEKKEQKRLIVKSIVSSRRHAEEALAEYMRSNEFDEQLKNLLEGELTEQIKKLKINQVRLDVHSTKESCLPYQITLRCIKQALEEKFFGKDVAAARTTAEEEKEAF